MTEYRIQTIMRTDAPVFSPETPIRRAAAVLTDADADAAAVVGDDFRVVGILSQKDCFRPALHAIYHHEWSGTVSDHMSPTVVTIGIDEEVTRAAEMFLSKPHRVFPVLRGETVAGLLHRSDVFRFLMRFG